MDPVTIEANISGALSVPIDASDPMAVLIAWLLTQAIARWGMGHESRLRAALPYLAMALAVGFRVVVGVVQGEDLMSTELLVRAFGAGAAAVWSHSATPKALKALMDGPKPKPKAEPPEDDTES